MPPIITHNFKHYIREAVGKGELAPVNLESLEQYAQKLDQDGDGLLTALEWYRFLGAGQQSIGPAHYFRFLDGIFRQTDAVAVTEIGERKAFEACIGDFGRAECDPTAGPSLSETAQDAAFEACLEMGFGRAECS